LGDGQTLTLNLRGLSVDQGATFNQTGGTLATTDSIIGDSEIGTFNQSGGTHTVSNNLSVGDQAGSSGFYNLSDGELNTFYSTIGSSGTGTFNQSGGTHSVDSDRSLSLGLDPGGSGTYNMSGGELGTGISSIGVSGFGNFIQTGGEHGVFTNLFLGMAPTGVGTYELRDGNLFEGNNASIGVSGRGTFTQSGGSHSVAVDLILGDNSGSQGTYNLSGGSLLLAATFAPSTAYVGNSGTGIFNQSGGTNTVTGDLILGNSSRGIGIYNLGGGSLLITGPVGSGNANIGYSGIGVFYQTGGTHTVTGAMTLAVNPGSQGFYNLSGGTLTVDNNIYLNAGGFFNQTGGTLSYPEFHHQGGTVLNYLVNQSSYIYNSGLFSGRLLNYGSGSVTFNANFAAANGLAHHSSNEITLAAGRSLTFNGQGLEVDQGAVFSQTGGNLSTSYTIIGNAGVGTFHQNGGSHTINNTLILAANSGSIGTYNLGGGILTAGNIIVNTGGVLNQTGGSLVPGNTFTVGSGGTFNQNNGIVGGSSNTIIITEGLFNLNDGIFRPGNSMIVRNGGTFNQNNGIVDGASNTISIFEGTCNVNGGTYQVGTLNLYAGSRFNWLGGSFSYNTLNFQGGIFTGNLDNWGTISGSGTINGNVMNHGNVNPGNSPGVLNVVGSFAQASNGTYTVEIASASNYDQIIVSGTPGTATIAGTLAPTLLGGYPARRNLVLPGILTATGGVSGRFSSIANQQFNPILFWQPRYNANSVDLLALPDFANSRLPLTANQRNVGVMLNELNYVTSGDLSTVLDNLSLIPTGTAVADAYQQISPDKASALPALSLAGSTMQWQNVANRLSYQRWRQGGLPNLSGGRSGSMNLSYNNLAGLMLAYNGADLTGMTGSRQLKTEGAGTWGLFTDFVSSFGSQDSTTNITGYDFTIFGFTLGADYRFLDDLVIGLGTGYYNTSASYKDSGGNAGINNIPFYAYGAYTPGSFYVMGYLGYTLNLYSLDRNIAFGGINRTATSSVDGSQLNASLETGYDFKVAQFTVTPAFSFCYSTAWVGGFTEDGAGALNLDVASQSADSVQTGLGMRLSRPFQSGTTIILPQIYAFYQHEFANNSRGLDARLAQTGSTFGFQTGSPSRDFALLGAGLAVGLRQNLTLQANYNTEVGRSGYTPHMVSAGLRYEF
jgi:outer membrane autotransporter protein